MAPANLDTDVLKLFKNNPLYQQVVYEILQDGYFSIVDKPLKPKYIDFCCGSRDATKEEQAKSVKEQKDILNAAEELENTGIITCSKWKHWLFRDTWRDYTLPSETVLDYRLMNPNIERREKLSILLNYAMADETQKGILDQHLNKMVRFAMKNAKWNNKKERYDIFHEIITCAFLPCGGNLSVIYDASDKEGIHYHEGIFNVKNLTMFDESAIKSDDVLWFSYTSEANQDFQTVHKRYQRVAFPNNQ